ncbi:fluoride efflux transporter CrcB [Francisellaceae bacterium]|nr:fluoride efflux transporter CrcB [Francisellaceae bacterium]
MLIKLFAILIGGGLGAVSRFLFSEGIYNLWGRTFPYGILACNILGSLIMGILTALFIYKLQIGDVWKAAILTGFLGGFTTFSSFSIDTLNLINAGEYTKAGTYILLSLVLTLGFVFVGFLIGKNI